MIPGNDAESFKMWAENETVYGPVDIATLVQWIQDDRVFPETFVQRQSDSCWRRAADVETLREKFPVAADAGTTEVSGGVSSAAGALRPVEASLATYWIPQPPVYRATDSHGRIVSEASAPLAAT